MCKFLCTANLVQCKEWREIGGGKIMLLSQSHRVANRWVQKRWTVCHRQVDMHKSFRSFSGFNVWDRARELTNISLKFNKLPPFVYPPCVVATHQRDENPRIHTRRADRPTDRLLLLRYSSVCDAGRKTPPSKWLYEGNWMRQYNEQIRVRASSRKRPNMKRQQNNNNNSNKKHFNKQNWWTSSSSARLLLLWT